MPTRLVPLPTHWPGGPFKPAVGMSGISIPDSMGCHPERSEGSAVDGWPTLSFSTMRVPHPSLPLAKGGSKLSLNANAPRSATNTGPWPIQACGWLEWDFDSGFHGLSS